MQKAISFLLLFLSLLGASAQVYHACPMDRIGSMGYQNPLNEKWLSAYDVKFYDLQLSVSNSTTEISGEASILIQTVRTLDTLVLELQNALEITRIGFARDHLDPVFVALDDYEHLDQAVYIPIGVTLEAGHLFYILLEYRGEGGQTRGFFTGISSATDPVYGFDVTYTLSEPHNARDWFPVKQVLEDQIDSVWMSLECDDHLMAASNGLLQEIAPGENSKHTFRWKTRYPMAYYLLSFTVADYRDFSFNAALSREGDSVLVQNYIYDSDALLLEWEEEIRETGAMISLFSDLLIDYPFSKEKYGHAMAPMGGGMEHQTMTTIQDFSFYLVAHELAHQWFGDYITCGNWQDIWINEGFASYMEYVAGQHIRGEESAGAWMSNAMSIALGETRGAVFVPQDEVEDPFRLFDYGLSYKKGAILLHMIRYRINDDLIFFKVLRAYLDQFGPGLADGDDFRTVLESETRMDFSCFFEEWYYGEGYPRFNILWYQEGDSLRVVSEQSTTAPEVTPLFKTPFDLEIRLADGSKNRVRLTQADQVEDFTIPVEGPVIDILFDPDNWILNASTVNQQRASNSKFTFGPNPVKDELFIQLINNSRIEEILITNMSGQEVLRNRYTDNPVLMDLSGLADGPYLLVINESDHTYMERIVKISGD